jgi:hexosaminidase
VPSIPERAARNGNRIILTPVNPVYFDYAPNKSSLFNVYHIDMKQGVPNDKAHLIKGAQANLWSEYIPSENRADFMMFPRLTALAERVWTNQELYESYMQRVLEHYPRLEAFGVHYRLPDIQGFAEESVFVREALFDLKSPHLDMHIRYTTDGSEPTLNSPILATPVRINRPQTIHFALFNSKGVRGDVSTVNYRQSKMHKAVRARVSGQGLNCAFYNQRVDKTTKIRRDNPDTLYIMPNATVPEGITAPSFGLIFSGYINIPETGIYNFYLTCDDGGMLYIGNSLIVDNEGPHSPIERSGQAALEKGLHPFRLDFVEWGGGYTLRLEYSFGGSAQKPIPDSWFVR